MATKRGGNTGRRTPSGNRPRVVGASPGSEAGQSTRWWSRLSGRGRWLALAGVAGALAGGVAGWWGLGEVTYQARAAVQLGTTQTSPASLEEVSPDRLVGLRVDQVIERELAELRRLAGDRRTQAHDLAIEARRADDATTRLDLTATATDPETPGAALEDILAAYLAQAPLNADAAQAEVFTEVLAELNTTRAEAAAARARLAEARAAMRENRDDPQAPVGPITELDPAWSAAVWSQTEARRAADSIRRWLSELNTLPQPEPKQVAALDPEAAVWWGRIQGINAQLVEAVWPPNPAVASRLRERLELEAQLQERAEDTRIVPLGEAGLTFRAVRLSETESQLASAKETLAAADARVAELEPRLTAWRELNAGVKQIEAQLAEQEAAIVTLDPGSGLRLLDAQQLTPEAEVYRDGRPLVAGLLAGAGLLVGVGLLSVIFLFDKRVRRSRDGGLIGSSVPVLGAVPTTDPSQASTDRETHGESQPTEVASIQAVRAVLESRMRPTDKSELPGGAFAVTGIAAGSGATSVAVGLAASMALSGSRVLLIDLAWLQKPAGSGTDDEAARDGLGVDGVIEELGYLDDEDREALTLGEEAEVGFGAILKGVSLRRSVVQTRVAGLAVLSAMGRAEALRAEWAGRVSSRWLRKLMEVSRRGGYTATILDAGSATGSVEGMLGCAAADGTVVVVSGGQPQADYDKAVTRLRLVGATIIGTVLNRSDARRPDTGKKRGSATAVGGHAAGGTTGSGIFAAAIEAKSGRGVAAGSGHFTAPLPTVEDEAKNDEAESATPQRQPETTSEASVDPFDEPPTQVQPTPARTPPRGSASSSPKTPTPAPEPAAAERQADTPSPTPAPEVHVADDVMDQLVDHAIRSAARKPRPTPKPATSEKTDPDSSRP
ncbi:MAG: hypothetical protein AAGH99_12330 [Planctomycetota bacterium]